MPLLRSARPHHACNGADHVMPHKGNVNLFFVGALQSLCAKCHNSVKQADERRGYSNAFGADGYPIDPRHPANR